MSSFYCELEGLDRVMNKLNKIQNMDTSTVLNTIADESTKTLRSNTSSGGFPKSSQSCKVVNKGNKYMEIGYKGSFDNWKELYFHNFGYMQYYYGRPLGYKTVVHVGCWDNIKHMTIEQVRPVLERRVREYLKTLTNS